MWVVDRLRPYVPVFYCLIGGHSVCLLCWIATSTRAQERVWGGGFSRCTSSNIATNPSQSPPPLSLFALMLPPFIEVPIHRHTHTHTHNTHTRHIQPPHTRTMNMQQGVAKIMTAINDLRSDMDLRERKRDAKLAAMQTQIDSIVAHITNRQAARGAPQQAKSNAAAGRPTQFAKPASGVVTRPAASVASAASAAPARSAVARMPESKEDVERARKKAEEEAAKKAAQVKRRAEMAALKAAREAQRAEEDKQRRAEAEVRRLKEEEEDRLRRVEEEKQRRADLAERRKKQEELNKKTQSIMSGMFEDGGGGGGGGGDGDDLFGGGGGGGDRAAGKKKDGGGGAGGGGRGGPGPLQVLLPHRWDRPLPGPRRGPPLLHVCRRRPRAVR